MLFLTKNTVRGLAMMVPIFAVHATEWSDTYVGYRFGTQFSEPFNSHDITKNILNLSHASSYRYGSNFFNVDLLLSNGSDPANVGSNSGAQELYTLYRHTLDFSKILGQPLGYGPLRNLGLSGGFDLNAKEDAGYNSRKRMLVAGPTVMFEVPGFLNVSLFEVWESNSPYNGYNKKQLDRYHYDPHPMLNLAWGIPFSIGQLPLSFEGYANFIDAKGKNEFGGDSKPETNVDMQVMYDLSPLAGSARNTLKLGFEYQYWKNKFGNDHKGPAGNGAFAKTPMIRAEIHF